MDVSEFTACDATELAKLLKNGDVQASEVHDAAVRAIAEVNPQLNAVADGPWEKPLDYNASGPFGGVPFVVKDLVCHTADVPMRAGSRLTGTGGVRFGYETHLMSRFRDAGFAAAALTTTPEMGFNANTEALVYGSTHNPWDLDRSPGGSSGGTAALVAARAVPAGHANDGGGSIRIPAAFSGLVGLKPSRGRTPLGPDYQEALSGLAIEFVLTRSVRDCAGILDAVAGAMPGDKFVIKDPSRPWASEVGADPGALRVAVHTGSWAGTGVDPQVAAAVDEVGRQLQAMGHHVESATPVFDWEAFIASQVSVWCGFLAESVVALSAASGIEPGPDTLEHTTLACCERGRDTTVVQMAEAAAAMNSVCRMVGEFFTNWDLLLTPTANTAALPLGFLDANDASLDAEGWTRKLFDNCSFTPLFNVTGTPAISLPLGQTSDGLPIGVQVAGPMCGESTLIQVASQLEQAMPWSDRLPPVHAGKAS